MNKCNLCPRNCGLDRSSGDGACGAGNNVKLALVSVHNYEEPCISGINGSGTIFFSNCNLKCVYCQNNNISQESYGKEVSVERLEEIFLEQQERGVDNINLVTPTLYVDNIIKAIRGAKLRGLSVPIIYNSSGYEKRETIEKLKGIIDVYLPDFKYASNKLAKKYSGVDNYVENAEESINEMIKQVGPCVFNKEGIIQKGVIIRHMILPNNVLNSKLILKKIIKKYGEDTFVSIMAQYFPAGRAKEYPELNRKITAEELKEVEEYLLDLNLINGYIQELGEYEEEYVPDFNLANI